jgi:phage head maturation protease
MSQLLHLRAEFKPSTFDPANNTVEVIFATETPYQRRDAKGNFAEVLSLNPAHVDLSRLIGASVLNTHNQSRLSDIVGVVESARVENGLGLATVKLSTRPDVAPYIEDIKAGVIRFLSVGYQVFQFAEGKNAQGDRTKTATRWQPFEISFVPVPADPNAIVRGNHMPNQNIETTTTAPDAGVIAHRATVRDIAKRSGLDSAWADTQIDLGATLDTVKALAHDAMLSRSQNITVRQVGPSGDDPAVILERRIDGLHSHTTGNAPKPESREFAHDSLSDHVRSMLNDRGVSTRGISKQELLQRAAMRTTSDFAALLSGVGNRSLLPAYQAARSPLVQIFRKQSRTDFRASYDLRIGEISELKKVTEAGEIKSVGRSELSQSYLIDTYAGMFTLSRKALINDDLGAFADSARAFGQAAATTEAKLMVALLESNPVMAEDNVALFHATHGNLGTAAAIDTVPLSEARKSLRKMKGLDGKTPIAVQPKYMIVSADNETAAEQALASIAATTTAESNPFAGSLTLLVDPRLAALPWYVAGDPSQVPCLSYALLSGNEVPTVEVQNLWDVLGTSVRAYHDFGVGAQDYRGLYKNAGA